MTIEVVTPTQKHWVGRWFRGAAIYGVIALAPMLFMGPMLNASGRPLSSPETYYGFVLAALVFQTMFWVIGGDPVRFRPLMPVAILEKLAFFIPVSMLFALGRTGPATLGFAIVDLLLGAGFFFAWRLTPTA